MQGRYALMLDATACLGMVLSCGSGDRQGPLGMGPGEAPGRLYPWRQTQAPALALRKEAVL